uniref:Cation efflux protein n=1 Tax=Cyanothece sp. (strain PCC 7425 / ATCC 29141) TaxID=395961 RepID=B8HT61_CYAP4
MSDCGCQVEAHNAAQRRTLRILLAVNGLMFGMEIFTGLLAHSTALIADSLDMLADAIVYGISLAAIQKTALHKAQAALLSGGFQILLAGLVVIDGLRRFLTGSDPEPGWMLGMGLLALAANLYCLSLIARHRRGEVHMRASWIFSRNDVIANVGVIGAGILVQLLQSRLPDLFVGLAIALLVLWGGIQIVQDAQQARRAALRPPQRQP